MESWRYHLHASFIFNSGVTMNKGRRGGLGSMLVEPYIQIRLGLMIVVLNLVFAVLIAGVFGFYIWDVFKAMETYFQLNQAESLLTWSKFIWPLAAGGLLVFVFIGLTFFITVKYTHKIYGPLISVYRFLDEIIEGNKPQPLKLRTHDELGDLVNKLNLVYEKLGPDSGSKSK